ncbi:hypothetical protein RB195_001500 [Necator americanus]|uniref:GYF domain-containing protein n=1 Tax=Necator americanus TaxID=51031 RepID=A0ABR1DHI7_NECAM
MVDWEFSYLDAKGNFRGPFTAKEMRKWFGRGFFHADLEVFVHRGHLAEKTTVGELCIINGEKTPFTFACLPVQPIIHRGFVEFPPGVTIKAQNDMKYDAVVRATALEAPKGAEAAESSSVTNSDVMPANSSAASQGDQKVATTHKSSSEKFVSEVRTSEAQRPDVSVKQEALQGETVKELNVTLAEAKKARSWPLLAPPDKKYPRTKKKIWIQQQFLDLRSQFRRADLTKFDKVKENQDLCGAVCKLCCVRLAAPSDVLRHLTVEDHQKKVENECQILGTEFDDYKKRLQVIVSSSTGFAIFSKMLNSSIEAEIIDTNFLKCGFWLFVLFLPFSCLYFICEDLKEYAFGPATLPVTTIQLGICSEVKCDPRGDQILCHAKHKPTLMLQMVPTSRRTYNSGFPRTLFFLDMKYFCRAFQILAASTKVSSTPSLAKPVTTKTITSSVAANSSKAGSAPTSSRTTNLSNVTSKGFVISTASKASAVPTGSVKTDQNPQKNPYLSIFSQAPSAAKEDLKSGDASFTKLMQPIGTTSSRALTDKEFATRMEELRALAVKIDTQKFVKIFKDRMSNNFCTLCSVRTDGPTTFLAHFVSQKHCSKMLTSGLPKATEDDFGLWKSQILAAVK